METPDLRQLVAGLSVSVRVASEGDLIALGRSFIQQLLRHWERTEMFATKQYTALSGLLPLVTGRGAAVSLRNQASMYVDARSSSDILALSGDDATTLNRCGRCRYALGGIREDRCSTPVCGLLPRSHSELRSFTTVCSFTNGSETASLAAIEASRQYLHTEHQRAYETLATAKVAQRYLRWLLSSPLEDRPLVPMLRPNDWFKDGDAVRYRVDTSEDGVSHFVRATVKSCYPYGGGFMVAVSADALNGTAGETVCLEGKSARLIKEAEFLYLREHPSFLELWLWSPATGAVMSQFDATGYDEALAVSR